MTKDNIAIRVENLTKRYGKLCALNNVSFSVKNGELFALLGPNGAGKTTLVRILTGLTKKGTGKTFVNGKFGLVPQTVNLDYDLTVVENLFIHGLLYAMPLKKIRCKTNELLSYAELSEKRDATVRELSGGMRRRLLIARALLHEPQVLFLDEPTVGLDPHIRRKIWSLIKRIQHSGTTILLTTHYIEEAEFLADRVAILDHGCIVALDAPKVLMERLGSYALDVVDDKGLKTFYFPDKKSAQEKMLVYGEKGLSLTLRRVTLEDVVIKLTAHKKGDET